MAVDKTLARTLRKSATPAEKVLWERLRDRQLVNLKFLRQVPIGPFVADFCCRDRRLIVELDGEVHDGISRPPGITGGTLTSRVKITWSCGSLTSRSFRTSNPCYEKSAT
ncbi:MAG TPA: endonuclease domain-containing protein [Thermoanaerobaculia bacterium]|nr:endonuclease domain-containing protein [Thermoanaerobaculia bacterium]